MTAYLVRALTKRCETSVTDTIMSWVATAMPSRLPKTAILVAVLCAFGNPSALASVDLVGSWTGQTDFNTNGLNYTPGAGADRLVLIMITAESTSTPVANVGSVTLGTQTLTAIEGADGVVVGSAGSNHNIIWLGYLDESGIAAMSGNAVGVTWDQAPNKATGVMAQAATYQNVNQVTPIVDSASNTNTASTTIAAGTVSVGTNDRLVYVTVHGITTAVHSAQGGYTEQLEQGGDEDSDASAQRDVTACGNVNPTAFWSTSSRVAIISAVLNASDDDISSGLDGFWKLNDAGGTNATDSSGNANDGTLTNAAWVDGMFGGALDFDGTGDYVDVPTSIGGSDLGSVSFWFRTETDFTDNAHLYYGSDVATGNGLGGENELHVNFTSSETIQFFIEGTPDVSITSSATYADGAWHHVAATWDISGSAELFVDGTSEGSATHDADSFTFSSTHRLARPATNTRLFTGKIDDVRLYNRAIDSCEVAVLAKGSGLLGHWKFDDGVGGTAVESVGGNDGTVTGATWVDGRLCGALNFDGSGNDEVEIGDVLDIADGVDLTIAGWFNRESFTSDHTIMDKRQSNGAGYIVRIDGASDKLEFVVDDGTDAFTMTSTSTFTTSGWNHFALVFDEDSAANSKIYINGTDDNEAQSGTIGDVGSLASTRALHFGRNASGSPDIYDGILDDVRFYNSVLSATDVQELAATYTIVDLGTLNGERGLGVTINNSEQVAGFDQAEADGAESAWRSQYCLMTGLGTLTGGSVSAALGINDAGTVCGWSDRSGGKRIAFTWTSGGGMVDLGTLAGKTDSEATGINANGEASGTALKFGGPDPSDWLAFLYLPSAAYSLPSGMSSLGTLGGTISVAMDLNDSGEVVGGAETASEFIEPFIWLPSAAYSLSAGMNSLGTLGDDRITLLHRAQAINSNGETVGRSYTIAGEGHAFIWLPSAAYTLSAGMTDLGVLTGGDDSWAFDINASGQVVGTSTVTGGASHAFIWENGTLKDLNNLTDTNTSWTLIRALGINDDGEIVGWATDGAGNVRAFMLVQTCSTAATAVQTAGRILAFGSGETSVDGTFEQTVFDETDSPLAEIFIDAAMEGADFTFRVTADSLFPPSLSAARPVPQAGLAEGAVVDRTLEIDATLPPGSIAATVGMVVGYDELDAMNLQPEDLELHVFDEASLRWVPAGMNIGESSPTDVVGESGYVHNVDDTITYWAVRDTLSLFAVGATAQGIGEQSDSEQLTSDPDIPLPSMCGVGVFQAGLFSFACLMLTLAGRRRTAVLRLLPPRESRSQPVASRTGPGRRQRCSSPN